MTGTERGLLIVVSFLTILLIGTVVKLIYVSNDIAVSNALLRSQTLQIEYLSRENAELQGLLDMMKRNIGVQRLTPDTLNLVNNALLAMRYYIHNYDSELPYWSAHLMNPTPYLQTYDNDINEAYLSGAAALRSMVLLRNMVGGNYGIEIEEAYRNLMLSYIDDIGLLDFVQRTAEGGLGTLINWYIETGDEQVRGLIESAVEEIENDAEYHESETGEYIISYLYGEGGGSPFAYIRDLVNWYEISGDRTALNLAGNMSNYFLYHSNYVLEDGSFNLTMKRDTDFDPDWPTHVHKTMSATVGIVKWGIATGNREVIDWGKRIFDYVWGFSGGIGWTPENLKDYSGCETCCVRDMVLLSILFAENGYPNYWNIVERITRNQLVENQLQNTTWISRPTSVPVDTEFRSYYDVADRVLGVWGGWTDPNDWVGDRCKGENEAQTMHCCLIGGEALYAVWHNIVTKNETGVYVNLNLNRDSKWVLVNSYMPYEGKVELLVHDAPTLYVKVPDWANRTQVNVTVDDSPATFEWKGEYVKLAGLSQDQKVIVTYPQRELVEKVRIGGLNRRLYTLTWRGDTVVEIAPKGEVCPLYQREQYKQDKAPMKMVSFHVPAEEISFP